MSLNIFSFFESNNTCLFSLLKLRMGDCSASEAARPATLGLDVVVAGAFCVPKPPEVWLIGRTEKPRGGGGTVPSMLRTRKLFGICIELFPRHRGIRTRVSFMLVKPRYLEIRRI